MKKVLGTLIFLFTIHFAYSQCTGPLSVTIEGSGTGDALDATGVATQPDCNALSGTLIGAIDITVTGGTQPYQYSWTQDSNPTVISTSEDLSGLGSGIYTVDIIDAAGCTAQLVFEITEPTPVDVVGTPTDLDCNSASGPANGSIDITASGGTEAGDYTYSWSSSDGLGLVVSAEDQSGLTAGTYDVTVTDDNGCTATASFTLTEPTPVQVIASATDLSCNDANGPADGAIDLTASGGTGPYTFAWTTADGSGLAASAEDQTGLSAGTYDVVVTDANNCTVAASYTLTQPDPIDIVATEVDLACNAGSGAADGEIDLTITGGTGPYTFAWTTADGSGLSASAEDQTGLSAGTYDVVVTDANNCTASATYTLDQPTAVDVAGVQTDLSCNSADGAADGGIDLTVTGGTSPYIFAWTTSDGSGLSASAEDQSGLSAGTYDVLVTDANGCTDQATFTLSQPLAMELAGLAGNLSCHSTSGPADGSIDLTVTNGTGPYSYAWTTADGSGLVAGGQDQLGLSAGTYDVVVTDANNCTASTSFTLTEPTAVDVVGTQVDLSCHSTSGAADGSIDITASGGTGPYTYAWTTADGSGLSASAEDQSGLSAGTYDVVVTDANNCTASTSFTLTEPTAVDVVGSQSDLACNSGSGAADGSIDITASGGTAPYIYAWTTSDGSGLSASAEDQSGLSAGTYDVLVTDANGCTDSATFTLSQPTAVDVVGTQVNLSCNSASGPADGSIDLTASGGTAPYTYAWTSADGIGLSASAEDQSGLSAGTYDVVVTDANNCTASTSFTLTEPTAVQVIASATDLSCNSESGAADGAIDLTASGGTGPYTFAWTTADGSGLSASAEDQTGLSAGTYDVVVTDANNCTVSASYTLTEPTAVDVTGTQTDLACNSASGAADGVIDLTVTGGTGPYIYAWTTSDGSGLSASSEDQSGLSAGTYDVLVTDVNGCTDTATFTLSQPTEVACTLDSPVDGNCGTNIGCAGGTGTINVTATGGSGTYTYSIDGTTFQANPTFTVLAGTHTVTVQDANGCTSTCEITLTEPAPLVAGTCIPEMDECQVGDGQIEVEADGGCAPYTVTWTSTNGTLDQTSQTINAGGESVIFTGAQGGAQYIFTVTDANGCVIGG